MNIFNVYHEEEWVGSFLQASFSTREKAEYYVKNNPDKYPESEMCIVEYTLDSAVPNTRISEPCKVDQENGAQNK